MGHQEPTIYCRSCHIWRDFVVFCPLDKKLTKRALAKSAAYLSGKSETNSAFVILSGSEKSLPRTFHSVFLGMKRITDSPVLDF